MARISRSGCELSTNIVTGITIAIDITKSGNNSKTTAATTNVIISGAVVLIVQTIIWGLVEAVVSLLLGTAA